MDVLLVERGLFPTRARARAAVMAGVVLVGGRVVDKPGTLVKPDVALTLKEDPLPYVSRGGLKLQAALDEFGIDVAGAVALDVGASTGGFTDCLLSRGARLVFAVDVGKGQLALKLRQDPRVVVLEGLNARYLKLEDLGQRVDLACIDVSFISALKILPATRGVLKPRGRVLVLVKPQFEAGPRQVGKGGVVRDPRVHEEVLKSVCRGARAQDFVVHGLAPSPLRGPAGNLEFWLHLTREGCDQVPDEIIHRVVWSQHRRDGEE